MFLRNTFYFLAGMVFLFLAKTKNLMQGYSSPKPFDLSDVDRCIDYDLNVVDHWLERLDEYAGKDALAARNVLELGPGSDLGIGAYLIARGCSRYNACDVNDLVRSAPDRFYERLLERLDEKIARLNVDEIRNSLAAARSGGESQINYVVRDDFDLVAAFGRNEIDLVVSQAAFEHFDDIDATVERLTEVCRDDAIAILEIDLMTHSRWIRDKDPNNIYRYPAWLYRFFWFRGIPNRVRPYQYKAAFERNGWSNITITPQITAANGVNAYSGMSAPFRGKHNQMEALSFTLCARKN